MNLVHNGIKKQETLVFNIQRFSLHDGSGIRTNVFFKGCPLKCPWCSNPEGIGPDEEIMIRPSKCIHCSSEDCFKCETRPEECPSLAKEIVGKYYEPKELAEEVIKDRVFYLSDGGVTVSGGEPVIHAEYLEEFLLLIKAEGINTAIETAGNYSSKLLNHIIDYTDTFLFDLKILDAEKFKGICGGNLDLVIDNFKRICLTKKKVIARIPLIPNYTDDEDNLLKIAGLCKEYGCQTIHLLPYHRLGIQKYEGLQREYTCAHIIPPAKIDIDKAIMLLKSESNINIEVGG